MSHRKDRISHFVREVVSEAIANRVSDPRVNRFTSVTRVEVSADMKIADVYVSVMGSEAEGRTTMRGLQSARGMIQSRLAKQINMRQCPMIRFRLDLGIKKAIDTIRTIQSLEDMPSPVADDVSAEEDTEVTPKDDPGSKV